MTHQLAALLEQARIVMNYAHAPYSHFKVGACFQSESGNLFTGCNVENAAYPVTFCAEVGALTSLIASGQKRIHQAVIVSNGKLICTPCGKCRQMMSEFADGTLPIHMFNADLKQQTATLGDLLPYSFSATQLE